MKATLPHPFHPLQLPAQTPSVETVEDSTPLEAFPSYDVLERRLLDIVERITRDLPGNHFCRIASQRGRSSGAVPRVAGVSGAESVTSSAIH